MTLNTIPRAGRRAALLTAAVAVAATSVSASASSPNGDEWPALPPAEATPGGLSLTDYYAEMGKVLDFAIGVDAGPPTDVEPPAGTTARDVLAERADFYRELGAELQAITPPPAARAAHQQYIDAAAQNVDAFEAARSRTPESAPAADTVRYTYSDAEAGYAFVAETEAKCALNRTFDSYGFEPYVFQRWCEPMPRPGDSLGSPSEPVNDITLVNEVSAREGFPNMWYDVTQIIASSSEPISITFENSNPEPFLFNLAIYEGPATDLQGRTPIAQTVAAGPTTHQLDVTLEPGVYTYADNVHAYSMRGTLIVVP